MPFPTRYLIDKLRKLDGDAYVTHPDSVLGIRRVERVFRVLRGTDEKAYLTNDPQYADTVLVEQHTVGGDQQYVEIYQAYENLPSSWVPFTRYDEQLGPIQGRMRAVVNTGQVATLGPTSKATYQGRNGSALVLIETQENWSDGSGDNGNEPYPISTTDDYEKERGPIQIVSQVVVATGNEAGSLTVISGVATYVHYEPVAGYAPFLLRKIVETWAVPAIALPSETVNEDGTTTVTTKQLALAAAIVEGETIGGGFWTKISSEAYSETIRWKVTAVRPLPGNAMVKTSITSDGDIMTETRTLVQLSTVTTQTVVISGVWTRTFEEPVSALVATKVVQVRNTQQTMPSYSIEIPDPVPPKFRILVPTTTTETTEIGSASMPTLGTGELSRTETQIDQFTFKRRITSRAAITLPVSLTDTRVTDDGQIATEVETLAAGIQTVTPNSDGTTVSAIVDNLGNNTSLKTVVTVPSLFTKATYETEIPDLLPKEFSALLNTRETVAISAGTASQPTLASGQLDIKEEQLTVQLKRVRTRSRDLASLPATLTGKATNAKKQVVTVNRSLKTSSIAIPSATQDVAIDQIGDGTLIEELRIIPVVFDDQSYSAEKLDRTPPEFKALLPETTTEVTTAATSVSPPTLGATDYQATAERLTAFTIRTRTRSRAAVTLPATLSGKKVLADGRQATITKTLASGLQSITATARTEEAQVDALGDGNTSKVQVEADEALAQTETRNEQPTIPPRKFLTITSDQTIEQVVESTLLSPDALGSNGFGVVEASAKQTEKFKGTKRTRTRAGSAASSLTEYGFNRDGLLVTKAIAYGTDGSAPTPTINTEDIDISALGDGKFQRTIATRSGTGFVDKAVFEESVPEFVPARFLNTSDPESTVSHIVAGAASVPTLNPGSGELMRREETLDAFTKRVTSRIRVNTGFAAPDGVLSGHGFDEQFGFLTPYTESIITGGSQPTTANSEVTPLNANLDLLKVHDVSAQQTALAAFSPLIFPGTTNVDLPTELKSVTQYASDVGVTDSLHEENTSYALNARGNGSLQCGGSASASAAQTAEVNWVLKDILGSNVPCHHVLFFKPNGTTRAAIVTYLGTLGFGGVTDWPKFAPRQEGIICKGARLAARQTVNAHATSTTISKYDGAYVDSAEAGVTGSGNDYDRSLTTKTVRLPPTIHPSLSLAGTITGLNFITQARILGAITIVPPAITGNATASVTAPTLSTATPGTATLPTSGIYLARLVGEPYKFGYIKYHAELVKFDADAIISIN